VPAPTKDDNLIDNLYKITRTLGREWDGNEDKRLYSIYNEFRVELVGSTPNQTNTNPMALALLNKLLVYLDETYNLSKFKSAPNQISSGQIKKIYNDLLNDKFGNIFKIDSYGKRIYGFDTVYHKIESLELYNRYLLFYFILGIFKLPNIDAIRITNQEEFNGSIARARDNKNRIFINLLKVNPESNKDFDIKTQINEVVKRNIYNVAYLDIFDLKENDKISKFYSAAIKDFENTF
jgi:hypothetical protein